jgi:hypothetical protein
VGNHGIFIATCISGDLMQTTITQIHPLIQIRRTRTLPVSGTVLVRVGQKVTTSEVIAEAVIPTQHYLVDVFRALGLRSVAEAEKLIDRKVGDQVDKNDILAETGGMFSRVIRAPKPGRIVSIINGQILIETRTDKIALTAGFSGSVVDLIEDRGAVIETNGLLIQGLWGNEQIGFGPLAVDAESIEKELTSASLSITSRGAIISAAYCTQEEVFTLAASLPVGGLILGSMLPDLIPAAMKQNYPIILLEGFGRIGINETAKKLIISSSQREVSINAARWNKLTGVRPEMIISLPVGGDSYRVEADFAAGQTVRVHTAPYNGRVGWIENIIAGLSLLPNGCRAHCAAIKFQDDEKAVVPLANLDIIDIKNSFLGKTE